MRDFQGFSVENELVTGFAPVRPLTQNPAKLRFGSKVQSHFLAPRKKHLTQNANTRHLGQNNMDTLEITLGEFFSTSEFDSLEQAIK